jgi:hypothetical protein
VHWETLCPDVRLIILSKVSLRALARVGTLGREFQEAYLAREQAALIATGEEAFGKDLFDTFVMTLQRAMCGLSPWPRELCEGGALAALNKPCMLFNHGGKPKCEDWYWPNRYDDAPCGMFGGTIWQKRKGFIASLYDKGAKQRCDGDDRDPGTDVELGAYEGCRTLRIGVDKPAQSAILGLLLAVFTQNPKALLPSFPNPLEISLSTRDSAMSAARKVRVGALRYWSNPNWRVVVDRQVEISPFVGDPNVCWSDNSAFHFTVHIYRKPLL